MGHPLPQKFRVRDDLGTSWDSVANAKVKGGGQQISELQDNDFEERRRCEILETLVWVSLWCR